MRTFIVSAVIAMLAANGDALAGQTGKVNGRPPVKPKPTKPQDTKPVGGDRPIAPSPEDPGSGDSPNCTNNDCFSPSGSGGSSGTSANNGTTRRKTISPTSTAGPRDGIGTSPRGVRDLTKTETQAMKPGIGTSPGETSRIAVSSGQRVQINGISSANLTQSGRTTIRVSCECANQNQCRLRHSKAALTCSGSLKVEAVATRVPTRNTVLKVKSSR